MILKIANLVNDIYDHKISKREGNKELLILLCNQPEVVKTCDNCANNKEAVYTICNDCIKFEYWTEKTKK